MSKHIAFLRAINVGGHNVKMDYLRQLFESIGFSKVETFIASGNVIFDAKAGNIKVLERKIESCLHEALGYEVATFIRTYTELAGIANYNRSRNPNWMRQWRLISASWPKDSIMPQNKKLMSLQTDIDDFRFHGREIYWLCKKKQSDSKISNVVIEKTLGMKTTLRGVNTVNKIAEKYY
jgi:uncharacterized protein (DUF1697 family)